MKRKSNCLIALFILITSPMCFSQEPDDAQVKEYETILDSTLSEVGVMTDLSELLELAHLLNPEAREAQGQANAARAKLDGVRLNLSTQITKNHEWRQLLLERYSKVKGHVPSRSGSKTEYLMRLRNYIQELEKSESEIKALTGLTFHDFKKAHEWYINTKRTTPNTGNLLDSITANSRVGFKWDDSSSSTSGLKKVEVGGSLRMRGNAVLPSVQRSEDNFPEPERIKELLENPVGLVFEDISLAELVEFLKDTYDLNFNIDVALPETPITINLDSVSMRHALLAVAEQTGDLVFVIREYGIFATTRARAMRVPGMAIPNDIPYMGPDIPLVPVSSLGGGGGQFGQGGGGGFGRAGAQGGGGFGSAGGLRS